LIDLDKEASVSVKYILLIYWINHIDNKNVPIFKNNDAGERYFSKVPPAAKNIDYFWCSIGISHN